MHRLQSRADVSFVRLPEQWPLLIMGVGLLALFVPSYVMLAQTSWQTEAQSHGPIILMVIFWLAWSRRKLLLDLPNQPSHVLGWMAFVAAAVLYVVGRSQDVDTLEVFSHLPFIAALLLLIKGKAGLRWGLFMLCFMLFVVPLPALFVIEITTPLKVAVSHIAEGMMRAAGLPVARSGVILYVGQYQLMVADACAGLSSIFTLEALGFLYMNIMNYNSIKRNVALAVLIVPIAFVANIIRVMILVAVTYWLGDEAGQGFVHSFAGIVLFIAALVLILTVDGVLGHVIKEKPEIALGKTKVPTSR